MVWLSMVVMVPFDLSIIDSSVPHPAQQASATDGETAVGGGDGSSGGSPLVVSIETLAVKFLSSTGPARDAAAILLARLLTRPGLHRQLSAFITWGGAELDQGRAAAEANGGTGTATFLSTRRGGRTRSPRSRGAALFGGCKRRAP